MVCRNTPQAAPELKDISEILGPFHQALTPERKPLSHLICKAKKKPSRPSGFSDKHAQVHSRFIALLMFANATFQRSRIDDFPKFKHHWRSMLLFHRFLLVGVACVYLEEMVPYCTSFHAESHCHGTLQRAHDEIKNVGTCRVS